MKIYFSLLEWTCLFYEQNIWLPINSVVFRPFLCLVNQIFRILCIRRLRRNIITSRLRSQMRLSRDFIRYLSLVPRIWIPRATRSTSQSSFQNSCPSGDRKSGEGRGARNWSWDSVTRSFVRSGVSPDVTIEDDDDDWRGIQSAFNEILVQRARMNNRPCERAGRPSWWRARRDKDIFRLLCFFTPDTSPRNVVRLHRTFKSRSSDYSALLSSRPSTQAERNVRLAMIKMGNRAQISIVRALLPDYCLSLSGVRLK